MLENKSSGFVNFTNERKKIYGAICGEAKGVKIQRLKNTKANILKKFSEIAAAGFDFQNPKSKINIQNIVTVKYLKQAILFQIFIKKHERGQKNK